MSNTWFGTFFTQTGNEVTIFCNNFEQFQNQCKESVKYSIHFLKENVFTRRYWKSNIQCGYSEQKKLRHIKANFRQWSSMRKQHEEYLRYTVKKWRIILRKHEDVMCILVARKCLMQICGDKYLVQHIVSFLLPIKDEWD